MSEALLPPNATQQERAIAETVSRISDVPVPVRDVWNAQTCPSALLPWLAWAWSVDDWDDAWTEEQKRGAIAASLEVHRHKGTIGAVQNALKSLGYGARVQEWFNQTPQGAPYTFKLLLESDQVGINQDALAEILRVVTSNKNLRSHLDEILPSVTTQANLRLAGVSSTGGELTIAYGGGNLISDGSVLSDGSQKSNGIKV